MYEKNIILSGAGVMSLNPGGNKSGARSARLSPAAIVISAAIKWGRVSRPNRGKQGISPVE